MIDDGFVILYCVKIIEKSPVKFEDVQLDLFADLFVQRQEVVIALRFTKLLEQAVWVNHLTGKSQRPVVQQATQGTPNVQR
jgi:hypothetical protein